MFTHSECGQKEIPIQLETALTLLLPELSIKDKTFAKITLLNSNTIVRVKQMVYTHQYIQEFDKQIKELLDKGYIGNSKSSHTSPTFMREITLEKKGKKVRMTINYKKLNDNIVFDGYYTPNKTVLFNRIREAS